MAKKTDESQADLEAQVWNAIAAFEQILEAMPDDRSSLETLAHAYTHIGDRTRAKDYLVRLARVVLAEQDAEAAVSLPEQFADFGCDPEIDELLPRLQALAGNADAVATDAATAMTPEEAGQQVAKAARGRLAFSVADELALAWSLLEDGQLTQDDYSAVAHDLSEMSTAAGHMTISVLHVLENRAYKHLERVIAHIATRCQAPVITLHCFDPPRQALELLPLEFVVRRGAVVFDFIKDDALVAVMNPLDQRLRADVAAQTGRICHFFTTQATAFDTLVNKIRDDVPDD